VIKKKFNNLLLNNTRAKTGDKFLKSTFRKNDTILFAKYEQTIRQKNIALKIKYINKYFTISLSEEFKGFLVNVFILKFNPFITHK
jgi:hypothetical protein